MPSIFSCHDTSIDITSSSARIVPHFNQRDVWDCGLACVAMICGYIAPQSFPRDSAYNLVRKALESSSSWRPSFSLWTIQLVLLLHKLLSASSPVNIMFSSTILGVDSAHADIPYYATTLDAETQHIEAMFEEAKQLPDLTLKQEKLDLRSMISVLMNPHEEVVFLCLVDARKLRCKCRAPASSSVIPSVFRWISSYVQTTTSPTTKTAAPTKPSLNDDDAHTTAIPMLPEQQQQQQNSDEGYIGHYVLVVGYHSLSEQIIYRNPAQGNTVEGEGWLCAESIHTFEAARAAVGTDYDTVMVAISRTDGSGNEEDFGVL